MRKIPMFLVATACLVGSVSAHATSAVSPLPVLSGLNLNLGRVLGSLPLLGSLSGGLSAVGDLPVLGGVLSGSLTAATGGLGSLPALEGLPVLSSDTLPGLNGVPAVGGQLPALGDGS